MVRWAYILLGNGNTGKTTFQKEIVRQFANEKKARLDVNMYFDIVVRTGYNNTWSMSVMNRSFQEKQDVYNSVPEFFKLHFQDADACILSSHLVKPDVKQMIVELKRRFFNVCGVFLQNSIERDGEDNAEIALLDWDEKLFIENPQVSGEDDSWEDAIHKGAVELTYHLMQKV